MKTAKIFLLTFTLFLTNLNNSYCKIFDYGFEENEDYIEITDIENIYAPRRLRKILDYYSKLDLSKKSDRNEVNKIRSISDAKTTEEYLKLFKEKFIVTQIQKSKRKDDECGDGSFRITFTIYPAAMEALSITIKDDDKICEIWDHEIELKRYRDEYLVKDYSDYWL